MWQLINGECGPAERPLRSRLKLFVLFPVAFRFAEFFSRSSLLPLSSSLSHSPLLFLSLLPSLSPSLALSFSVFVPVSKAQLLSSTPSSKIFNGPSILITLPVSPSLSIYMCGYVCVCVCMCVLAVHCA